MVCFVGSVLSIDVKVKAVNSVEIDFIRVTVMMTNIDISL